MNPRRILRIQALFAGSLSFVAFTAALAGAVPATFIDASNAAMDRMMAAMDVKSSGDVDRDFIAMMIPHHQGAIDMAQAQLRFGKNEQLKRIAQEIIVEQQQEIAAMHLALGDPPPQPAAAPTQAASSETAPDPKSPPHVHPKANLP